MMLAAATLAVALLPSLALAAEPDAVATPAAAAPAAATPAPAATTPTPTSAAKLIEPRAGHHFDHLERAPMVQFSPGAGETPRWVLLAIDRGMTKTVRYCRQFVWATSGGTFNWGCNRWATGADQAGGDVLLALEPGTVYYWQVVSKKADGNVDVTSEVRSFAIKSEQDPTSVAAITAQVHGTAFDDGTQLNLGAAAFVNSKVRVKSIASTRLARYAFRIRLSYIGTIDHSRSYVKVNSVAGARFLKVAPAKGGGAVAIWRLNATERRLRTKRFAYQAHVKSAVNGAMVKSQLRVLLIRTPKRPPAWTPDR